MQAAHWAAIRDGSRSVGMQPTGHSCASTLLVSCTMAPRTPTCLHATPRSPTPPHCLPPSAVCLRVPVQQCTHAVDLSAINPFPRLGASYHSRHLPLLRTDHFRSDHTMSCQRRSIRTNRDGSVHSCRPRLCGGICRWSPLQEAPRPLVADTSHTAPAHPRGSIS